MEPPSERGLRSDRIWRLFQSSEPPDRVPVDLHRKLLALTGARLLVGTALLVATAWLTVGSAEDPFGHPVEGLLYGIITSIYLGSLVAAFFLRAGRWLRQTAYAQVAGDVAAATGLVYLTGGPESIFTILYPLAIVNGAIGLGRKGASFAAIVSAAAFCLLVLATELGLLHAPVYLDHAALPLPKLLLSLAANLSAFLLTAALSSYLSDALVGARRQLEQAETELSALSALHESIVRSITSGILTIDGAARITYVNPAGEEITGYRLRELRGHRLGDRFPDFDEALRRSQPGRGETTLLHPDGSQRIVGYSLAPLIEAGTPSLPGFVVVFQDLTSLRRMEEAMHRTDRLAALGKLAAGLAHEIRNPLASMSGSIELLSAGASLQEKERRLMRIVQREAERLDGLVGDFLSFARPNLPQRSRFDLSRLIDELLVMVRPTMEQRGVDLVAEVTPRLEVQADPGQIKQVLWNLVGNALEATPGGGRVLVRARSDAGSCVIEVHDSGAGIPAADLPRIFDPFFTTKERGTGLGLAIVHRIVEAHGGRVEVASTQGQGSRFEVWLTAAGATGPEEPAEQARPGA